jgi:hypothetical protein
MNIETKNVISVEDIQNELNIHFSKFEFTQMAENGSYVEFCCDDDAREDLVDNIDWYAGKGDPIYERLSNELVLMDTLRYTYGIFDSVLVHVFW